MSYLVMLAVMSYINGGVFSAAVAGHACFSGFLIFGSRAFNEPDAVN